MRNLWTNRNFLILWAGQLISTVGNNLYYLALPWYVLTITGSRTDLVLSGLAIRLPALARIVVGVFVDRWPKKSLMLAADGARLLLAATLAWIAARRGPLGVLLVGVVLFELAGTFFSPAESALLPLVVPPNEVAAAEGIQQSSAAIAGLVGKLIGGPLLVLIGAPLLFLTNAASFVFSLGGILGVRVNESSPNRVVHVSFFDEWKGGIQAIWQSPGLSRLVWSGLLVNFGVSSLTIVLATWVKTGEHGTAPLFSVVSGSFLAGSVIGGIAFGMAAHRVRSALLRSGTLVFGLCIGILGLVRGPAWTVGCMGVAGVCDAVFNSWVGTYLVKQTPEPIRGRVFSTFGGLMLATGPLGLAAFGSLLAVGVSIPLLFAMMGAFAVAAGFITPLHLPEATSDPVARLS